MTMTELDDAMRDFFGEEGPPTEEAWAGEPENPTRARLAKLRDCLVDTDGLDGLPDPVPLIDGVLFRDSLAWLYGKPGSGKSFVAIDWAGHIANGIPWDRRGVSKGNVLHLVAEGASGIRQRVRAWEHVAGIKMSNVTFLPVAVQLLNGIDLQALTLLVQELDPALIIIDTQARCTVGANENDNGEMSNVVDAADKLRAATGACVLMIHHSGRNGENLRGASALDGAATSVMKVVNNDGYVELHCEKQKDVDDFATVFMRMRPVLNSCVLENRVEGPVEDEQMSKADAAVLSTLGEVFASTGATPSQLIETSGISKASVYRVLARLEKRGAIRREGTESRPRYMPIFVSRGGETN